nr:transglycosylase family protein [Salsipaludibacter albus]
MSTWDALAECESNGQWDLNIGLYDGGLQFHPTTWNRWKKSSYPAYAWQASKAQQIEAASRLQADQGWAPWPFCTRHLGLR